MEHTAVPGFLHLRLERLYAAVAEHKGVHAGVFCNAVALDRLITLVFVPADRRRVFLRNSSGRDENGVVRKAEPVFRIPCRIGINAHDRKRECFFIQPAERSIAIRIYSLDIFLIIAAAHVISAQLKTGMIQADVRNRITHIQAVLQGKRGAHHAYRRAGGIFLLRERAALDEFDFLLVERQHGGKAVRLKEHEGMRRKLLHPKQLFPHKTVFPRERFRSGSALRKFHYRVPVRRFAAQQPHQRICAVFIRIVIVIVDVEGPEHLQRLRVVIIKCDRVNAVYRIRRYLFIIIAIRFAQPPRVIVTRFVLPCAFIISHAEPGIQAVVAGVVHVILPFMLRLCSILERLVAEKQIIGINDISFSLLKQRLARRAPYLRGQPQAVDPVINRVQRKPVLPVKRKGCFINLRILLQPAISE